MASNPTKRQLQIARRRKIRAIEAKRDQEILKRDNANTNIRKLRNDLKQARS